MYNVDFTHNRAVDDWTASFLIKVPGIYHYECEFEVQGNASNRITGAFLVEPRLYTPGLNSDKNFLPLDAISIITVIPKWMPTVDDWLPYFNSMAKAGYNMVHFAPINTRGASNSPYSIYNQLDISSDLFEKKLSTNEKWHKMSDVIASIFKNNGMLSVTDVVWNHMASNSVWLEEHPEAAYNLKNSPHLRPAAGKIVIDSNLELDAALMEFSRTYCGSDCSITTDSELNRALSVFKERDFANLKLWQFYVIDKVSFLKSFQQKWTDKSYSDKKNYSSINVFDLSLKEKADLLRKDALIDRNIGHRYSKTLDIEVACSFIYKLLFDKGSQFALEVALREIESIVDEINLVFYQEFDSDTACIFDQVQNRAHYLRVAENGPKLGKLTKEYSF
jgi:glycogen debranching enzyme